MHLYGFHTVWHALKNPNRVIHSIKTTKMHPFLVGRATLVSEKDIDQLLRHKNHQGLVAEVDALPWGALEDVGDRVLILDQITDPQNLGALLRSAAAFGFTDIITKDYGPLLSSPVVARVACGGLEYVRIVPVTNIVRSMEQLKQRGFWCYGLDEQGTETVDALSYTTPTAFVVGSEGSGIRRLVRATCDVLVRIPTMDFGVLNAAQAATVAMFAGRKVIAEPHR